MPQTNITIFYAPEDQKYFDEFVKHLRAYSSKHIGLNIQHESKILASQDTQDQIQNMLNNAHIVILLLSIDLENHDNYNRHRQTILTLHKQNKIVVLPIRLREYHWQDSDWNNLTPSPPSFIDHNDKNCQCVTDYGNTDTAFTKVIDDVDKLIANLQTKQLESQAQQGTRLNSEFWIMVLSTNLNQLVIDDKTLPKKQRDKLTQWSQKQYGEHVFDWKPFTNGETIGKLLEEYAHQSKFDVQLLNPNIYEHFSTLAKHKKHIIVIVDCLALSYCNNKKNKEKIATLFNIINEIGGLLIPICEQADADIKQHLISGRDSNFKDIFTPYYQSGLQSAYIYIEINVPNKNELFRKLSNIAVKHLKLTPIASDLQFNDMELNQFKNNLPTSL
ncbi:MAG: toll/interleukin-1 receptor domain-containing protein [Chitinophagales bacterium]|jgi:hypothetical protein|nr:toll/interleukin-1 receptor domain-containing protein [Chitinophagales bacterium]